LDDWTQSRIITSASARILDGRTTVHFHRFVTEFGGNPLVRIQSPWETEVWVQRNNNPAPTQQEAIAVMREVDAFRARALGPAAHEGPSSDVLDVAKRQLADLTDLHNQIVYGADEARRNADREFDARRARLEEEWEERRKALESEHDVKRSHILEEESAVKQLQKELDDRGHMHARRELRADITKSLKELT
jgi:hypothetical protein